jgi:hypothetical protein
VFRVTLPKKVCQILLVYPELKPNHISRSIHRQPATYERQRAQVVGTDDLQERHRGPAWTCRFGTACQAGLWTVGCFWKTKGGYPPRQQGLLRQELCSLEDVASPCLLVSPLIRIALINRLLYDRDAFTTSSDFIISPHSAAKGLYVATCGNFHGWKFFPVLGKYIIEMLEGTLSPELCDKWAWDRERPDPKYFADWPRHEMKDLLDPVRTSKL